MFRVAGVPLPERVETISNTLEAQQKIVGGYIECVTLEPGVVLVCNEEGKLERLAPSACLPNGDVVCGDCFVCGVDDEGEVTSLNEEQVAKWRRKLSLRSGLKGMFSSVGQN